MLQFTPLFFVYAGVAVGAVVMAALADKRERLVAFMCSSLLLASWLLHVSSWTPWAPERWLRAHGLNAQPIDAWATMNMIVGLFVMLFACGDRLPASRPTWWAPLLFGFIICGSFNDLMFWSSLIDWHTFSIVADVTFLAEESVFFALGAPSALDRLRGVIRMRFRRAVVAACSKAPVA